MTSDSLFAPMNSSTMSPPLNSFILGIDLILYFSARPLFSSTFTFAKMKSLLSSETFSKVGLRNLQGPHHPAQKSTRTGVSFDFFITSSLKFFSVASICILTFGEMVI